MLWTLAPTLDGSGFLTFLEHPDSHTLWDGYDLAFRIIGSTTTAIAVPGPATVLPFLFGLAGIGLLPRRKRKRDHLIYPPPPRSTAPGGLVLALVERQARP